MESNHYILIILNLRPYIKSLYILYKSLCIIYQGLKSSKANNESMKYTGGSELNVFS